MTGTQTPKRDKSHVPHSMMAPKRDLRARVAAFLESNAPQEFTPKFISLKLKGVSHEAVKKAIQRELKDPRSRIVRVREGWYRYAHSIDTFKEVSGAKRLGIHGIQLKGLCPSKDTRYFLQQNADLKIKGMGEYSKEFNGRPITIRVYRESPTVLVWLKATKNPLDFEEFDKFAYWLYGWASGKVLDTSWTVTEWGWNVDFVDMDMTKSGFKQLTLHAFRNAWFRMYQKKADLLRVEAHLTPKDASLQDVLRIFTQMMDIAKGEGEYRPGVQEQDDYSYR
ncbi:MAG: hypothetical protein PHD43_23910 [Methylococcales bacterium]|nr:hypothetical protein [Methylococcales bacterium]